MVDVVLQSFYRRIETERGDHWTEVLVAEEANLSYARRDEKKEPEKPAVPLVPSNEERTSSGLSERSESIGG